jgi:MinD-like ATPase involved in chromosome partitioning or flagellar assembly
MSDDRPTGWATRNGSAGPGGQEHPVPDPDELLVPAAAPAAAAAPGDLEVSHGGVRVGAAVVPASPTTRVDEDLPVDQAAPNGRVPRVVRDKSRRTKAKKIRKAPTMHMPTRKGQAPQTGWRKWLYIVLFGLVAIQPSAHEVRWLKRLAQVRRIRLLAVTAGTPKIVVVQGQKGGVGKTTVSLLIGLMMKWVLRGLDVLIVDGNPHAGTLPMRIPPASVDPTAVDLIDAMRTDGDIVNRAQLDRYLRRTTVGAWVLAFANTPREAKAITLDQFGKVLNVGRRFFGLSIVDLGTGLRDTSTAIALKEGHQLVVVTSPQPDAVGQAVFNFSALLDEEPELARRAILVITHVVTEGARMTDVAGITARFAKEFGQNFTGVPGDPTRPGVRVMILPISRVLHDGYWDQKSGEMLPLVHLRHLEDPVFDAVLDITEAVAERLATDEDGVVHQDSLAIEHLLDRREVLQV